MEFRDYAATEASALIERLLARQSEASLQQILAVRDALDAAARALETPPQLDNEVQEFVGRLVNAAGTVVRRIREDARTALDSARAELESQRADNKRLDATVVELRAHSDDLNVALRREQERGEAADRDLSGARETIEHLEASRAEAEAQSRHEAQIRASVEEELRAASALLDESIAEAARVGARLETESAENATLRTELATARETIEQAESARQEAEEACRHQSQARATAQEDLRETRELLDVSVADAARLTEQLEAETSANATLHSELASVRHELDAAYARSDEMAAQEAEARAAADHELHDLRTSLDAALEDVSQLGAQLESSAAEKGKFLSELTSAQSELHTANEQRDAIATQLRAAAARLKALERSTTKHDETVKLLQEKLDRAMQARAAAGDQAASDAHAEVAGLRAEADRAAALLEACVHGVDDLAGATTIAGLLAALTKQLASQFSRVALFRVKGNRLEGEHQIGFDQTKDVTKLVIPLNMDSMLTRVVGSGTVESLTGSELAANGGIPLGGGEPTTALALPVVLQGETLAVVYVDDSGNRVPSPGPAGLNASIGYATLLVRQTAVLLMRLTHELKMLSELRDYATLLLQEAEQMYAADADSGKSGDDLKGRLKDTLDYVKQIYGHRAALEGDSAARLLDEQIATLLEGPETPFSRDLAAVVGRETKQVDVRRKAEAS
jgi:chromosome segregation ATPase